MRRSHILLMMLGSALLTGGSAAAQQIRIGGGGALATDDPRAVRAAGLVQPMVAGDSAAAAAYLRQHADPRTVGASVHALHALMTDLSGSVTGIERLMGGRGGDVLVALGGTGTVVVVELEENPPHRIVGLRSLESQRTIQGPSTGAPPPVQVTAAPQAAADAPSTLPATHPAHARVAGLIRAVNTEDLQERARLMREHLVPGPVPDDPAGGALAQFRRNMQGAVELRGIRAVPGSRLAAEVVNPDVGLEAAIEFALEESPPFRIADLLFSRKMPEGPTGRAAAPRAIDLDAPTVTVPMWLQFGNKPVVEVHVNGAGPFQFMVETGANWVAISPAVAEALGDRLTRSRMVATLDSLRIGGAVLQGVSASIRPLPAHRQDVDGVLGLPAFADLLLTVDYPAGVIRLGKDTLPAADGRSVLAMPRMGSFWGVELQAGGQTVRGVIDTQGDGGFMADPSAVESVEFVSEPVAVGEALIGGANRVPVKRGRIAGEIRLGAYVFQRPLVDLMPKPDGIPKEVTLGYDVLKHFAVTLDQRSGRVRFARESREPIPAPPASVRLGFGLRTGADGAVTIAQVERGSAAERAGLRVGDVLLSLAGHPASDVPPHRVNPLASEHGGVVPVRIRRDGREMVVEIEPDILVR